MNKCVSVPVSCHCFSLLTSYFSLIRSNTLALLSLAWDLGWIIALPIVLLGFGGALLDKKLATSPLFLISGILLSLIVTGIGIYRKINKMNNGK